MSHIITICLHIKLKIQHILTLIFSINALTQTFNCYVCVYVVADPSLRDREDQFGRTPLMYCVLADRLDCAEILLKAGASVNKTDHSQRTALHLAAQKV